MSEYFHHPATRPRDALALAHGAGSNANAPLLVAVAEALAAEGLLVMRFDLAFRCERPSGPPRPGDAARDQASLRQAAERLRGLVPGRVLLGGHSYGGRQATMLAAAEPEVAAGLLLLSYPLHPPHRPEKPRTAHLPQLRTPALFVHGARDPFGTLEEMREALKLIPAPAELAAVEGAGHDLKARGAVGRIVTCFQSWRLAL